MRTPSVSQLLNTFIFSFKILKITIYKFFWIEKIAKWGASPFRYTFYPKELPAKNSGGKNSDQP
jgi:hypothetical protein